MKVITSIYLSCRPDLRDEWLTGVEPDDAGEAQVRRANGILDRLNKLPIGSGTSTASSSQIL